MLKSVYLVTERNLQISLLKKELSTTFRLNILSPIEIISDTSYLNDHIVLLDLAAIKGQYFTQILSLVAEQAEKVTIALFNTDRDQALSIIRQHQRIRGLFFTDDSFETLVKGIHRLSEGEYWLPERLIHHLLMSIHSNDNHHSEKEYTVNKNSALRTLHLTSREKQILTLIGTGATNAEIADDIHLSENTVKTHLSNLYRKLGIKNRTQASVWLNNHLETPSGEVL